MIVNYIELLESLKHVIIITLLIRYLRRYMEGRDHTSQHSAGSDATTGTCEHAFTCPRWLLRMPKSGSCSVTKFGEQ
jgi:hypothetical protein